MAISGAPPDRSAHERYLELGIGVGFEFVQDNFSSSARGTRGEVFDVAVDIRRGSATFGRGAKLIAPLVP